MWHLTVVVGQTIKRRDVVIVLYHLESSMTRYEDDYMDYKYGDQDLHSSCDVNMVFGSPLCLLENTPIDLVKKYSTDLLPLWNLCDMASRYYHNIF